MKSIINSTITQQTQSSSYKKLSELIHVNKEKEQLIEHLEQKLKQIQSVDKQLGEELTNREKELSKLKQQMEEEEKCDQQEEAEIDQWIEEVQKYTGLPQQAIESLLTIEYEGNANDGQICLSCYKQLQNGSKCKYLPCAHMFHLECIDTHLKVSKNCPGCGEQVVI